MRREVLKKTCGSVVAALSLASIVSFSSVHSARHSRGMSGLTGRPLTDDERTRLEMAKRQMLAHHLRGRDISDENVLATMAKVRREEFVPQQLVLNAYNDHPLPLDNRATISQPYIVALMTQLAQPEKTYRALDVGTGSGYQAAVLAEMVSEVYSIEIARTLAQSSAERLKRLGYSNVRVKQGNGYMGWREHAPYDIIIVAAAPPEVPHELIDQLAPGGRLVIPVGSVFQELDVIHKGKDGKISRKPYCHVSFVPLVNPE